MKDKGDGKREKDKVNKEKEEGFEWDKI